MVRYLVRLDDACSMMDWDKWSHIEKILARYSIKPLVGVIPNNQDLQTIINKEKTIDEFEEKLSEWVDFGWSFALHGYNHVCTTTDGGINPIHQRSEFAGLKYGEQCDKLRKGYEFLEKLGITPKFFFAPSHTFDLNTIKALEVSTPIRIISDTFALKPHVFEGMVIIPQQMGRFRRINIPGFWTFCFHPNNMNESDFVDFDKFIKNNEDRFMSFDEILLDKLKSKSIVDKILSTAYLIARTLRK